MLTIELAQTLQLCLAAFEVLQLTLDLLLDGHIASSQWPALRVPLDVAIAADADVAVADVAVGVGSAVDVVVVGQVDAQGRGLPGFQEGQCIARVQLEGRTVAVGQEQGLPSGLAQLELSVRGNEALHHALCGATEGELALLWLQLRRSRCPGQQLLLRRLWRHVVAIGANVARLLPAGQVQLQASLALRLVVVVIDGLLRGRRDARVIRMVLVQALLLVAAAVAIDAGRQRGRVRWRLLLDGHQQRCNRRRLCCHQHALIHLIVASLLLLLLQLAGIAIQCEVHGDRRRGCPNSRCQLAIFLLASHHLLDFLLNTC